MQLHVPSRCSFHELVGLFHSGFSRDTWLWSAGTSTTLVLPTALLRWSRLKEATKSLSAVSAGLPKERRWASPRYAGAAAFSEGSRPELSHPFSLSSSCVSTISSSVWRASARQLATAELRNAGSGLTEEKNDERKIKPDKSKHIPCRDACSHPSLHRGNQARAPLTNKQEAQTQRDERIYARSSARSNVTRM